MTELYKELSESFEFYFFFNLILFVFVTTVASCGLGIALHPERDKYECMIECTSHSVYYHDKCYCQINEGDK
jgi:hypothetical protein